MECFLDETRNVFCPKRIANETLFFLNSANAIELGQCDDIETSYTKNPNPTAEDTIFCLNDTNSECSYEEMAFRSWNCNNRPEETSYFCPACNDGNRCSAGNISQKISSIEMSSVGANGVDGCYSQDWFCNLPE